MESRTLQGAQIFAQLRPDSVAERGVSRGVSAGANECSAGRGGGEH
jgi:hypothetical protein